MATIAGTYIESNQSESQRVNAIVDLYLTPQLVQFRQIMIYHEAGTKVASNTWRFTYQNWNPAFTPQLFVNKNPTAMTLVLTDPNKNAIIDANMGTITLLGTYTAGDNTLCTYCFDYFPLYVLEGFIYRSIDVINLAGSPTDYTVNDAPGNWDGVIADLSTAMAMEKLILESDLWRGRLIFALGPEEMMNGGGDILNALTTIKQNAEERANIALQNPLLKCAPYLAGPTSFYYDSLLIGGGRRGAHGTMSYGKLRGWRNNKFIGGSM